MFDVSVQHNDSLYGVHSERFEKELREFYHQAVPCVANGGRTVLYLCPYCMRLWLMQGRHVELVRLTDVQEWEVVRELRAGYEGTALPESLCRMCAICIGGTCRVEGMYTCKPEVRLNGYRLLWEGLAPMSGVRLLCVVARADGDCGHEEVKDEHVLQALSLQRDIPHFSEPHARDIVAWLKDVTPPRHLHPYTPVVREEQARLDPPHFLGAEHAREWCGTSWLAPCPYFGGRVLVSLALALPPGSTCPGEAVTRCWFQLLPSLALLLKQSLAVP